MKCIFHIIQYCPDESMSQLSTATAVSIIIVSKVIIFPRK